MQIFPKLRTVPRPVRGPEAIRTAQDTLVHYRARGVLIGGCAAQLWSSAGKIRERKDLDVLVLDRCPDLFPGQWECGIDWWVTTASLLAPTNGTQIGLTWNLVLCSDHILCPGLYALSPYMLRFLFQHELEMGVPTSQTIAEVAVLHGGRHSALPLPIVGDRDLMAVLLTKTRLIASHPKKG